jgi:hypothetical protein
MHLAVSSRSVVPLLLKKFTRQHKHILGRLKVIRNRIFWVFTLGYTCLCTHHFFCLFLVLNETRKKQKKRFTAEVYRNGQVRTTEMAKCEPRPEAAMCSWDDPPCHSRQVFAEDVFCATESAEQPRRNKADDFLSSLHHWWTMTGGCRSGWAAGMAAVRICYVCVWRTHHHVRHA